MSNAVINLNDQINGLITQQAIKKAQNMIRRYNSETDTMMLSGWLEQLQLIMNELKRLNPKPGTKDEKLLLDEFRIRWEDINRMITKAMKNRPAPAMTSKDRERMKQIKITVIEVFGDRLTIDTVVPFLLEANK